ncbi:DUF4252 domain-containing protein [Chryseobacterium sp. ISL-6]|uniref:DUF4252 domain-containing protein n=1 Tax=Chryseobacterium sp. ISL-6 TaxID=2819143 RepID=UPI001BEC86DB|nr:DUF4252 domain-containing protein [Chryseobacterium sp. ISL-6]MBT2622627.1 DUF4252 domain-containing protein [Chryseobacterium sp. ISL-6]
MKKILIIFALAFSHFFTAYGQEDKFDRLFEKYQQVEGVTSIKIAKPMFGMLSSLNIDDSQLDQIKPLLSKINGLRILITENPENADSSVGRKVQNSLSQINKDISSYLSHLNYNEIMTVNSSGNKIKFLSSEAKDGILDDVLLSIDSGDGGNVLVMLDGKLSMDDLNKIIKSSETKTSSITNTRTSSVTSSNSTSYLNGETRNVGEFSGIQVSTGVNVVYKQESPISVKVIADADKLQYVITKVENGILKVYVDNKGVKNLRFKNLNVNVSSPRMNNIKTSSGANFVTVNTVKEDNMDIEASSGAVINGKFNISNVTNVSSTSGANIKATISTSSIVVKASSGSDTKLEGQANSGVMDISSGAVCKAENLRINEVEAESTSGASLSINVDRKLKVRASSGGLVKYKGNPEIDSKISKMSGGTLKPID